jgi:hypothetical protein
MSSLPRQYSIDELIALRESPLVTTPESLPQMEQWMQPIERRSLANSQAQYSLIIKHTLTYPAVKMLTLTPNIVQQIHDDHVLPLLPTNPRGRFHYPWTSSNVIRVIITLSSPPKNKQ